MANQICNEEIQQIIHLLTSPFNDKYSASFLAKIKREIRDYKSVDKMEYEFMLQKFKSIDCLPSNEIIMELKRTSMQEMLPRRIEFIKKVRNWFIEEEHIDCDLFTAKNLVATLIKDNHANI